jgi:signal transduction histidine kinase
VANYGGLGLGLYIVKQLIDSMNGTITVESTVDAGAPEAGTTFRIELPYAPGT